jgi:hypothetical protein
MGPGSPWENAYHEGLVANSGMRYSTEKFFIISSRQGVSSKIGEKNTILSDRTVVLIIDRQHHRQFDL